MSLRHHPHMVLECVPLPKELGETAPMYFQKAIQVTATYSKHLKALPELSQLKTFLAKYRIPHVLSFRGLSKIRTYKYVIVQRYHHL